VYFVYFFFFWFFSWNFDSPLFHAVTSNIAIDYGDAYLLSLIDSSLVTFQVSTTRQRAFNYFSFSLLLLLMYLMRNILLSILYMVEFEMF